MSRLVVVALVGAIILTSSATLAAEQTGARCTNIGVPKTAFEAYNGKWIELNADQLQFLRGVYALNPYTPPGMPFGDKAVLAQVPGDSGGMVFFIDGERACTPMAVPGEIIEMILDVGSNNVIHEANGL